jgi:hypothetical protein
MIDKVYTVWSGYYSGIAMHAIFSTRNQAEEYCRLHNVKAKLVEECEKDEYDRDYVDFYRIKEMPLDPPFEQRPISEFAFQVLITRDGTYATTVDASYEGYNGIRFYSREDEITDWHEKWVDGADEHQKPLCGHDVMEMYVLATDSEHAIKIVSERRSEMLALERWPEKKSGFIKSDGTFEEEEIIVSED